MTLWVSELRLRHRQIRESIDPLDDEKFLEAALIALGHWVRLAVPINLSTLLSHLDSSCALNFN